LDSVVAAAAEGEYGFRDLKSGLAEMVDRDTADVTAEMEGLAQHSGEYWLRYQSDEMAGVQTYGQIQPRGHFRTPGIAQQSMRPTMAAEFELAAKPNYLAAKAAARRQFNLPADDYAAHWENPEWASFVAKAWRQKTLRGSTSSHPLELSGALRFARRNPLAAPVLNFMNTSKNLVSLASKAEMEFDTGQHKAATFTLAGLGVSSLLYAALQEALSFEEEEPFLKGTAQRIVSNFAGNIPVAGELFNQMLLRPLLGQDRFTADSGILLQDVVVGALTNAADVTLALSDYADKEIDQGKMLKKLGDAATKSAALIGLPGPAVADYTKRLASGRLLPGLEPTKKKKKKSRAIQSIKL